jgi:hypothetical protein
MAAAAGSSTAIACQSPSLCTTPRSARPIRMKIIDSSTNSTVVQTARACSRISAENAVC